MHKLRHGLTGRSRVRQIMTINDGLGGGVTRLRFDIIYEQINFKKTPENWGPGKFSIASMTIAGTTG